VAVGSEQIARGGKNRLPNPITFSLLALLCAHEHQS